MATPAAKAPPQKKRKKGGISLFLLILMLVPFPFLLPTLLVLVGMAPTLVALITDDDDNKSRAITIGSLNFAGVAPFLLELWQKGQNMDTALQIVRDPHNWLIMLGAAAVGQMILFIVPPLAASLALAQAENRLKRLKESEEELKRIWGPDVTTSVPVEQVRQKNGG